MEYIYAALLLHKSGKPVDEKGVSKLLDAAGIKADPIRVKALVASLEGVDIEEAIKTTPTVLASAPVAAAPSAEKPKEEKKEKEPEEEKEKEEAALEGLGALFG